VTGRFSLAGGTALSLFRVGASVKFEALTTQFVTDVSHRHLRCKGGDVQMTKQEQLAKAERDLEGILSRLFSEEWADWNDPKVQGYLKKTQQAFGTWRHANTHDAK
jgi:hypothetical protein